MIRRSLVALVFLCAAVGGLSGQEADTTLDPAVAFPRSIGIRAGTGSGYMPTLTYQEWLHPWGYSVEVGFFYTGRPDEASLFYGFGRFIDYRVAFGGQYRLFGDRIFDWIAGGVHVGAMAGHAGYQELNYNYNENYELISTTVGPYEATIYLFAGPGTEIILFRHFSLTVDLGFEGHFFLTPPSVGPIGIGVQVAARFRF